MAVSFEPAPAATAPANKTQPAGEAAAPPALVAATELATARLMHFLAKPDDREFNLNRFDERFPTMEHFVPVCMSHVHRLVNRIDLSYTDAQLQTVLENECWLMDHFDKVYVQTFHDDKDCTHFAKDLAEARDEELKSGKDHKYKQFCKKFYGFQKKDDEKEEKKKEEEENAKKQRSVGAVTLPSMTTLLAPIVLLACRR